MKRTGNIVELAVMVMIAASILMWFLEIDIQDVKDEYNSQTNKIERQSTTISANAEYINEQATRVINENEQLRKHIVSLEAEIEQLKSIEPEPSLAPSEPINEYGTGY